MMAQSFSTYPFWAPLAIVFAINLVVFVLTYWLFYKLKSTASITTGKWAAGGALAGFIIITGLEIKLVDHFTPNPLSSKPSYQAVLSFYDNLQYKRFHEAWNLIETDYQNSRWQGNREAFTEGFKHTVGIKLLAILLKTESSPASHEYVVYYVDQVDTPIIPGLEDLPSKPIKDIDILVQRIKDLRAQVSSEGFDVKVFDQVSLYQLMAPDHGMKITWLLDKHSKLPTPTKRAETLFPQRHRVEFIKAFTITTQYTKEGWRISSMVPVLES